MTKKNIVIVGQGPVSCEQIVAVARGQARVKLSAQKTIPGSHERDRRSMLQRALKNGDAVYGVNTGFGKACGKRMQADAALQKIAKPAAVSRLRHGRAHRH